MKNLIISLISLSYFLFSCSNSRDENIINYNLDTFAPISYENVFKKVEIIKLDSVPHFPMTHLSQIKYYNSNYFVRDLKHSSILVFNENGRFVRTVGAKGRGPGELLDIRDFQINRFTGNVEILGNATPIIMVYDTLGNFISKRDIGNYPNSIQNFYHINSDLTAWISMRNKGGYCVSVYSEKKREMVKQFFLELHGVYSGFINYSQPFSHYGDTTYFYDTYSNTVYRFNIKNLEFEVHKKFNFGQYNFEKSKLPPPSEWRKLSLNDRIKVTDKIVKPSSSIDKYIENKNYTITNKGPRRYIISRKKDNNTFTFNTFKDNKVFALQNMNENFIFRGFRLVHIDLVLSASMVGESKFHELKKLSLNDENEEIFAIVKYWFK